MTSSLRWRRLALIPQGAMNSLNPVMRVRTQIADAIVTHEGRRPRSELKERVSKLLDSVGLGEADISDPDNRVPVLKSVRLLQGMANRTGDEDIGLKLGQRIEVRNVGVVGYAIGCSLPDFTRYRPPLVVTLIRAEQRRDCGGEGTLFGAIKKGPAQRAGPFC